MKRRIVVVLSLVAAVGWAFSMGAQRSHRAAVAQERKGAVVPVRKTANGGGALIDERRQGDAAAALRQRLVELTAKHAQHLNAEQLTQAIAELNKTLGQREEGAKRGLEAALTQLGKVIRDLKAVSETFPGTEAGMKASQILKMTGSLPVTLNLDRISEDDDFDRRSDDDSIIPRNR